MTIVTGGAMGCNASITVDKLAAILSSTVTQMTATSYVLRTTYGSFAFAGAGFQYSDGVPVAGTITGFTERYGTSTTIQTWTGCNVAWSDFWNEMTAAQYSGSLAALNNLFYGGNDTFNMQASQAADYLYGGAGNDTFNYADNMMPMSEIDGGAGINTLNLNGEYSESKGYGLLGYVTNIQIVHLATGHNYYIGGGAQTTTTFDATELGAANSFTLNIFGTAGTITANGGAGNDTVIAGPSTLTFSGGGGSDTIDYSHATGALNVDLSRSGAQNVGVGFGSETLNSVENIITSSYGGTYTGNASDNVFQVGKGTGCTVNGGDGNDMIWFNVGIPTTGDTGGITVDLHGATPSITGVCGNVTFSSIESVKGTCRDDTFIGNAGDNVFDGGSSSGHGAETVDYHYATSGMTFTASSTDRYRVSATGAGQGTDTLLYIEHYIGSNYDDVFTAAAGTTARFEGGQGSDKLVLAGYKSNYRITEYSDGWVQIEGGIIGQYATLVQILSVESVQFADQLYIPQKSGTTGNDTLNGTSAGDIINISQGGDDTVLAGDGDDQITVNGQLNTADQIDGGAGYDTLLVNCNPIPVGQYHPETDNFVLGPHTVTNVEEFDLYASDIVVNITTDDATVAAGKTLVVKTLWAYVTFDGSAETDGAFDFHGAGTYIGGAGNDKFYGDSGNDVLRGGGGNDYFIGGQGNDTIDGGAGYDTVKCYTNRSAVTITHNANGSYTLAGPEGTETLTGVELLQFFDQDYILPLAGTSGNDTLTGSTGPDVILGDAGADTLSGGDEHDTLTGGGGNDTLDGGSNIDIAVFAGNRAAYTITQGATGVFTITGSDGTDTLTNIEYAKFDDTTMRLLPGAGATIDWSADPSTYMAAIRDFDGNDLGAPSGWKLIGTADVNGDGTVEHILVNRQNGRWAEISTETDGKSYLSNFGWAGDTRVVGIYIDPLVTSGEVMAGSDFDSQRRFQNDLNIENIHGVLGQSDYNHDGLQEIYFSLTDGTAYLHAYMHADGNIQYANYQNEQQVKDYLTSNGFGSSTWAGWFPVAQTTLAALPG